MIIDVIDKINGKVYTVNLRHIVYFDRVFSTYNVYHYNVHLVDGTIITLTHKAWNKLKNSMKKINQTLNQDVQDSNSVGVAIKIINGGNVNWAFVK